MSETHLHTYKTQQHMEVGMMTLVIISLRIFARTKMASTPFKVYSNFSYFFRDVISKMKQLQCIFCIDTQIYKNKTHTECAFHFLINTHGKSLCRMKINVYCTFYFRVVLQLLLSVVRTTYGVIKWNKIYHRYEYAQFIFIEWIYVLYTDQLRTNGQINRSVNDIFDKNACSQPVIR